MQIEPIDLTAVISVIMGISVVLIPVIGLTARFALKPTVEALTRVFESRSTNEAIQILERRVSLLERSSCVSRPRWSRRFSTFSRWMIGHGP